MLRCVFNLYFMLLLKLYVFLMYCIYVSQAAIVNKYTKYLFLMTCL